MRLHSLSGTLFYKARTLIAGAAILQLLTACTTAPVTPATPISQVYKSTPATAVNVSGIVAQEDFTTWFKSARALVEQQLNTDLSHVDAHIVDTDTINLHAKDSLLRALSHDIANHKLAHSLVSNILRSQSGNVLAIYAPKDKVILLNRNNLRQYLDTVTPRTSKRAALQALLLHELIHAADDVKHNVFDQTGVSYQEVFSKSTVLEGHAQWQARRLCVFASCSDAFALLNRYMFSLNSVDDPALKYIQSRNFKNMEFVYREGERFINHIMQRPNAEKLVQQAFRQPPRDSLQIINPASFPDKGRENRNLLISNAIKTSVKPWSKNDRGLLTRNVLAAAAFTANPKTRDPVVEFYTARVVAAAKHEYYEWDSQIPIPVAITVMETDNDSTASTTAALIFKSTADTYQGLDGDLVELNGWNSESHRAVLTDSLLGSVVIEMNTASGQMNNHMVQSDYPFEVVTASSGNFIVHVDGRYDGRHELMQYAGNLLLELQRRAVK